LRGNQGGEKKGKLPSSNAISSPGGKRKKAPGGVPTIVGKKGGVCLKGGRNKRERSLSTENRNIGPELVLRMTKKLRTQVGCTGKRGRFDVEVQ